MSIPRRLPLIAAGLLVAAVLVLVPSRAESADFDGGAAASAPLFVGGTSAAVGDTTAKLSAVVDTALATRVWFEFGTTTAYDNRTTDATLDGGVRVTVKGHLKGLQPGTEYHVRLVAVDKRGRVDGPDTRLVTSDTAAAPLPLPDSSLPDLPLPAQAAPEPEPEQPAAAAAAPAEQPPAQPDADPAPAEVTPVEAPAPAVVPVAATPTGDAAAPAPAQGKVVVAAETAGVVRVKTPGGDGFRSLADAASVPVGSVVDARDGTIMLSSQTASGTQTGEFRGAIFQVRQSRTGDGMTDLVLKGGSFAACRRTAKTVAHAAGKRRRAVRTLWGRDRGGRFRTRGRDSVATVRGTVWKVVDQCDGTLTTVSEGAVSVRDVHTGRRTLVRAGGRHFAPHR